VFGLEDFFKLLVMPDEAAAGINRFNIPAEMAATALFRTAVYFHGYPVWISDVVATRSVA